MRLALLHYTCPPVAGGVERVLADHARLFARHGHEVTVICGEGEAEALGDPRIEVRTFPEIRRLSNRPEARFDELKTLLLQQEIVFLHNVMTMPFHLDLTATLWHLIAEARRPRFVAWVHDIAAADPADVPATLLLHRAHPSLEYVAVSRTRRTELCAATGLPPERCRVIPNGIDPLARLRLTPPVRQLAEEWHLIEREAVVLHPTRLLRRKNVEASLHITAALVAARPTIPMRNPLYPQLLGPLLLVTGAPDPHHAPSAEYARELRLLRAELHLERHACFVSDYFEPTDADVDSLYLLADVLLYPSHQEGFGLPILEAALHRLPIFCSDLEALTSLLPAEDLFVFNEKTNPRQIAGAIMRRIETSRTIRKRRAVVQTYAWPAIYQNFLAPLLAGTESFHHP